MNATRYKPPELMMVCANEVQLAQRNSIWFQLNVGANTILAIGTFVTSAKVSYIPCGCVLYSGFFVSVLPPPFQEKVPLFNLYECVAGSECIDLQSPFLHIWLYSGESDS